VKHVLAFVSVVAVAALGAATIALAHAEPARVQPGDGAVLNAPPAQVTMIMSQDMARQAGANDIVVVDSAGKAVTQVAATIDNADRRKLAVPLPPSLAIGAYTVLWKTLSADDGDPADGTTTFTYDPAQPPSPGKEVLRENLIGGGGDGSASPLTTGENGGTSWVLFAAAAIGLGVLGGGAVFLLGPKRS
jgi:methionine-rich copper-binding protein CopC